MWSSLTSVGNGLSGVGNEAGIDFRKGNHRLDLFFIFRESISSFPACQTSKRNVQLIFRFEKYADGFP